MLLFDPSPKWSRSDIAYSWTLSHVFTNSKLRVAFIASASPVCHIMPYNFVMLNTFCGAPVRHHLPFIAFASKAARDVYLQYLHSSARLCVWYIGWSMDWWQRLWWLLWGHVRTPIMQWRMIMTANARVCCRRVVLGLSALYFWFFIIYALCTRACGNGNGGARSTVRASLKSYLQLLVNDGLLRVQHVAGTYIALSPMVRIASTLSPPVYLPHACRLSAWHIYATL